MEKNKNSKVICPISFNKKITFVIPGKPFGKQRPRVVHRGKFTSTYTPKETVEYENLVKLSYYNASGGIKLQGALEATIKGVFPIPKHVSKKQKEQMLSNEIKYTKKIDCDNMAKACLDALNNIAYDDDAQISRLIVEKEYGEVSKVEITLREIDV